jgi:hypothetical protein
MLPNFLLEETIVREPGESTVFDAGADRDTRLTLTLGITHAVENESIGIDIFGSPDGSHWPSRPIATFTEKYYCGTYKLSVPSGDARYLKAVWRPFRWSRADKRPFFRFYLHTEPACDGVLTASAA